MKIERIYIGGEPNGVYSDAVIVDDKTIYISGICSENLETGEEFHGDITLETRVVMENIEKLLARCGSDMAHIVKVEVFLADMNDRAEMNEEYSKHFESDKLPARYCIGNVALAEGFKIEVSVTAVK